MKIFLIEQGADTTIVNSGKVMGLHFLLWLENTS